MASSLYDLARELVRNGAALLCGASPLSPQLLSIGRSQYQEVRTLGSGGFSDVVLATDTDTGRQYAIKKMLCHDGTDTLDMAQREIAAGQRLQHPNIIPLYNSEIGEHRDGARLALLVFPLLGRGTLLDLSLQRAEAGEPLEERFVIELFRGVCQALQYLHSLQGRERDEPDEPSPRQTSGGYESVPQTALSDMDAGPLVHGDLKLANVMLADDGRTPVLMDFGSVRGARMHARTRAQALRIQDDAASRSSMPYRAPELFDVQRDTVFDERTDIWALGCLLFALAYGFTPFEDPRAGPGASIALAAVNARFDAPDPDPYSPRLMQLARFILVSDPQQRPFIDQVIAMTDSLYPS
ncbi:Serine/threonine-protein kinase env7 [Coemansia sp. RSA 2711]|nr:Serine/threonine-protein kinase env7 [Coemansia sp. RSA 2711]KAJ2366269.1 Serine/threonine-protein kinase env7 [Coemansia sp. RSA 2610]KAJ2714708.1 Serine/threonine-protein kinase env7 [Coemansia sp. Cherry 401B]